MQAIEERVDTLESLLGQFIIHTDVALTRLEREMRANHKEVNRQWAALAKKMGTLDEDLIAPATKPVLAKYFGCEPAVRAIRVLKSEDFEVDVLVVAGDKVFMIEVKSSPRTEYVDQILEKAPQFKKFFPEYEDKELIPLSV